MPTTTYRLAPNGLWQGRDRVGQPCIFGSVETFRAGTSDHKTTYANWEGTEENENPTPLDIKGEAIIYWADDEYYDYILRDSNGNVVSTVLTYPKDGADAQDIVDVFENTTNIVRNPQFFYSILGDSFSTLGLNEQIFDDWQFVRNNTNATITIETVDFPLGQTDVPGSPVKYLRYTCTNTGAGNENIKYISQGYTSVRTLANQTISFSFYAKSSTSSTVSVELQQFFGTGGSPSASVNTAVLTAALTNVWTRYTASITLPNINGKTLGSNGDDCLKLLINLPLNSVATVDTVNCQLQNSDEITDFSFDTLSDQFKKIITRVDEAVATTGDVKFSLNATQSGWITCNDTTIGNSSSGADRVGNYTKGLFTLIWNIVSNSYAPIYNSDGSSGTRGASAEADFNANKRLALTKALGRVLATVDDSNPIGSYAGAVMHTNTIPEMASHNHTYEKPNTVENVEGGGGQTWRNVTTTETTGDTGEGTPWDIRQPTIYLYTLIKL